MFELVLRYYPHGFLLQLMLSLCLCLTVAFSREPTLFNLTSFLKAALIPAITPTMSFLSENLQDCVKVVTVVTASCNTCTNLNESRTYEEAIEKCIEAEDRAHTVGAPNFTSMYRLSVFRQYEEDICNRFFGGPILRIQEVYPMVSAYVSYYTSTKTIYAKGVRRTEITTDEAISSSLVPRDHHPASITSLNISTLPAIPCGTNGPIFTRTSLDLYESAIANEYYSCLAVSIMVTSNPPTESNCETVLITHVPSVHTIRRYIAATQPARTYSILVTTTITRGEDPTTVLLPASSTHLSILSSNLSPKPKPLDVVTFNSPLESWRSYGIGGGPRPVLPVQTANKKPYGSELPVNGIPSSPTHLTSNNLRQGSGDIILAFQNGQHLVEGQSIVYDGYTISMSTSGKIIIDDTAVDSFYLLDFASVGGFAADGLQTWAISLPTGEYMLLASATLVQNGPLLRFSQDGTAIVVGGLYTLPLGPKTSAILNPSQSSSESVQAAHQTPASIEGNSVLMDVKTFSGGPTTGHVVFEGKSPHPVTWTRGIYAISIVGKN